nr:hypothetical protein pFRL5_127c [Streptomyces sp. F8]
MWVWAGLRVPRRGLWRLALVTVLAGLLHLLGCAHGPQATGLPRTDTLTAITSGIPHTHLAAATVVAGAAELCDHGGAAGCIGGDEPAAAGPRTDLPAPPIADDGLLRAAGGAWWRSVHSRASCGADSSGRLSDHSRTHAVLGVWRT